MNDFTKEELEHLYKHMIWACDIEVTELNIEIKNKIQTMIDNYCDHESCGSKGLTPSTQCRKCGVKYDDR